ncbi:hypothetical protein QQ045_023859 [Rhodiola kirilowii]
MAERIMTICIEETIYFKGPWEHFITWRDLKNQLQGTNILEVHPGRNNVAIALAFSRDWNIRSTASFLDLPYAARLAFLGDFLRLPCWRRTRHHEAASIGGPSTSLGSLVASDKHCWMSSTGLIM